MPPNTWPLWRIRFVQDQVYDIVEAIFENVELQTDVDVLQWQNEVGKRLAAFGRKVDLLIDLRGLVVRPAASAAFGRYRTEILQRYTLRSFRYNGDLKTRASISSSNALYNAASNLYGTREEALAALLAERRRLREEGKKLGGCGACGEREEGSLSCPPCEGAGGEEPTPPDEGEAGRRAWAWR